MKQDEHLYFVAAYYCIGQQAPDLIPVSLPRDIDKFTLIDDTLCGFDVKFQHRKRWCSLAGDVWEAKWRPDQKPTWAPRINVVHFARNILRKLYKVREMSWDDWEKRMTKQGGRK